MTTTAADPVVTEAIALLRRSGFDEVVETYPRIAAALTLLYALPPTKALSKDAAARLSVRSVDPLPTEGYTNRTWIRLPLLVEWWARNRSKAQDRSGGDAPQLPLFPGVR